MNKHVEWVIPKDIRNKFELEEMEDSLQQARWLNNLCGRSEKWKLIKIKPYIKDGVLKMDYWQNWVDNENNEYFLCLLFKRTETNKYYIYACGHDDCDMGIYDLFRQDAFKLFENIKDYIKLEELLKLGFENFGVSTQKYVKDLYET